MYCYLNDNFYVHTVVLMTATVPLQLTIHWKFMKQILLDAPDVKKSTNYQLVANSS